MSWTPLRRPTQGGPLWSPTVDANCETAPTPSKRRILGDISNTAWGLGTQSNAGKPKKRPLSELRTPVRRAKAFSVFEDCDDSVARRPSSPPQVRTKGACRQSPAPECRLFGIEELVGEHFGSHLPDDLPDVEDLPDTRDEDLFDRPPNLKEQCGFDSPTELVRALSTQFEHNALRMQDLEWTNSFFTDDGASECFDNLDQYVAIDIPLDEDDEYAPPTFQLPQSVWPLFDKIDEEGDHSDL